MAPSPVSGLRRPAPLLAIEAAVHQADHSARALRVLGAVVPVYLAQAFVAARPSDAVRDDDALPREGPIVGFVFLRLLLIARLAPRRRATPMQFVDARIALVASEYLSESASLTLRDSRTEAAAPIIRSETLAPRACYP